MKAREYVLGQKGERRQLDVLGDDGCIYRRPAVEMDFVCIYVGVHISIYGPAERWPIVLPLHRTGSPRVPIFEEQ